MQAERFIIRGDLAAPTFLPWVARHLHRLGLQGQTRRESDACVELLVEGPPDLIDAMEMGVSLGPIEAWVETIERFRINGLPDG